MAKSLSFKGRKWVVLPLSKLFVDPRMGQRSENKGNTKSISSGYDPNATRSFVVSKRKDGRFAILDGQHRFIVMKIKGELYVVCEVHEGLTYAEEAALFEKLNRCRPLKGMELFVARYVSGDNMAVQVVNMVRAHGFDIAVEPDVKTTSKRFVRCGATLYKAAINDGIEVLNQAFDIIAHCFRDGPCAIQGAALKGDFLPGLFKFLKRTDYSNSSIKAALKTIAADVLLAEAHRQNGCNGKRCGFNLPRILADIIEKHVKSSQGRTLRAAA